MSAPTPPPAARRSARWAGPLLLALVVALPHLASLAPSRTVFYRDLGLAAGPILEDARHLPDGRLVALPTWTDGLGEGRPLLANPGNALLAPGSLLYLLLPFEEAFELFLLLHCLLAAFGMRALARWLGGSEPAALLAGGAFGLGGFVLSSVNLYPTLAAVAWSPWVILAGLRAVERPGAGRLGALALALAASALGGQPEPVVLTSAVAAGWGTWLAAGGPGRRLRRVLTAWGLGGCWALLLAAPQVLPAAFHAGRSLRSHGFTTQGLLYNSLHPERLLSFAWPGWGGDPLERLTGGFPAADLTDSGTPYFLSLYLGLPVLLLALAALVAPARAAPRNRLQALRGVLIVTAVAGALLALGRHLPGAAALVDAVPAIAPFRYPVKLALLAHLAVPLLAAAGLDRVVASLGGARRSGVAGLLTAIALLELLVAHHGLSPTIEKDEPWSPVPTAGLLQARAAELGALPGEWRVYHHRLPSPWGLSLPPDERTEAELYRRQRRALFPAMGLPMGIDHAMDPSRDLLDPLPQFELARAIHASGGARRWLSLAEIGVLFVLSPDPRLEASSEGELVLEGGLGESLGLEPGEVWVYRVRRWQPRWRFELPSRVELRPEASARELVDRLDADSWPPPTWVADDPGFDSVRFRPGPWELKRIQGPPGRDRLDFFTSASSERLLVVADTLTPGWQASVDGRPVPLLRANLAYRAVRVPAGEHHVAMRFRPPGLRAGAAAAGVGLLLLGFAALRRERA